MASRVSAVEQLYSADIVEIVLDLPVPTSTNALWIARGKRRVKSKQYLAWQEQADVTCIANRQFPRHRKITGHYEMSLLVDRTQTKGDLSNKIKALEDWLVSRDIVRDDVDCQRLSAEWVSREMAPSGCRVTLRSLHRNQVMGAGR